MSCVSLLAFFVPFMDGQEKIAGVQETISRCNGMIHDFPDLFEKQGNQALAEATSALFERQLVIPMGNGYGAMQRHGQEIFTRPQ